ncbi:hypothetical rubredoxin/ferredoxin reductase [Pseudoclavibacter endophyticus]|uniref:NAD(P)/FAD-dependent oxidoreductase n=1 Tax=Pseudoclavibacter endophyticus TaxID=1778590 RepID=UPI00166BA417|nr:FAD-dependent oxidoreductase [Pseudoclavibacter endophyticus]GGA62492.1 hypothetical rubredoxin/ferredoxin reductase [Pseudoclavibacter endophyticus]
MTAAASVVIVGGGIAGVTTARQLRAGGFGGSIRIVESEPLCYDRPPLSKAAFVEGASLASLAFATADEYAGQDIEVVADVRATGIEAPGGATGSVTLSDGRVLEAEAIVLATGAQARSPSFPGGDLPIVGVLRGYRDAVRLRAAVSPGARVLVVGAGFIGAELTSGLVELGAQVVLVDRNPVPGSRVLGGTLAGYLHGMHAAHGVDVRVGSVVDAAVEGVRVRARLDDGSSIAVDAVVVGAGIAIDTSLAASAGAEIDDAIIVDGAGRTSVAGVWAAGDATRRRGPDGSVAAPIGHWEAAELDGRAVAADILSASQPTLRGAGWYWSDRYGIHLEVTGRLVGEGTEVVRWAEPGRPAAVFRLDGAALVGAASIDDSNAVRASRRLIDQRIPLTAAQLADPAVSLRDLLRKAR